MTVKKSGKCYSVTHGSPQKPGSKRDKPEGTVIKKYCPGKEGVKSEEEARKKAYAMHTAIVKSKDVKFSG